MPIPPAASRSLSPSLSSPAPPRERRHRRGRSAPPSPCFPCRSRTASSEPGRRPIAALSSPSVLSLAPSRPHTVASAASQPHPPGGGAGRPVVATVPRSAVAVEEARRRCWVASASCARGMSSPWEVGAEPVATATVEEPPPSQRASAAAVTVKVEPCRTIVVETRRRRGWGRAKPFVAVPLSPSWGSVVTAVGEAGGSYRRWFRLVVGACVRSAELCRLCASSNNGTWYIYYRFIMPCLAKHEPYINTRLQQIRTKSGDLLLFYLRSFTQKGQSLVSAFLQYVVKQGSSSTSKDGVPTPPNGPRPPPPPPSVPPPQLKMQQSVRSRRHPS